MRKIKSIAIAGSSTFTVKNHGDESMLLGMINSIRRYDNKIKIFVICRHPNKNLEKKYKVKMSKNFEFDKREDSIGKFFYGFNEEDKGNNLENLRKIIEKVDLILLGGNLFMEIFPNSFLKGVSSGTALFGLLAKLYKKKIALFGVNVVAEVRDPLVKQQIKFISEISSQIQLREKSAYNFIKSHVKDKKKLLVQGDPAFAVNFNPDKSYSLKILNSLFKNVNFQKKFIGVCLRIEYWKNESEFINKKIVKKYADIISNIAIKANRSILFIPNNTYNIGNKHQDDRKMHSEIISYLDKKVGYLSIDKEIDTYSTVSLFSLVDFHITNRRHSFVYNAMHGNAGIIFDISFKGHLMPLVKELNAYDILIDNNLSRKTINDRVNNIWNNKIKHGRKISQRIKKLRSNSLNQFNKILESL